MTYWILPWNAKVFNLEGCLNKYGFVDWRTSNKIKVDDIVFLYSTLPIGRIMHMFDVESIVSIQDGVDDSEFFKDEHKDKPGKPIIRFRLKAKKEDCVGLTRQHLIKFGLPSSVQSGIKVSGSLLEHILSCFNYEFSQLEQDFIEGQSSTVSITSYERNPEARAKCLRIYGYQCQICGFDFEKTYGELGKNFIHVHHINFISQQGGEAHKVNPIKDLIPVCPNCHAMLHHKTKEGNYLLPIELKDRIKH